MLNEFWTGVTGDKDKAFSSSNNVIPDNTYALCEIIDVKFVPKDKFPEHFQITWKIIEGPYQKRLVWQKIHAFDENPDKALRGRNMLMLTYNVTGAQLPEAIPTENDLMRLVNKIAKIRIQVWEEKQRNWVSEVHDTSFQPRIKETDRVMDRKVNDFEMPDDALPF